MCIDISWIIAIPMQAGFASFRHDMANVNLIVHLLKRYADFHFTLLNPICKQVTCSALWSLQVFPCQPLDSTQVAASAHYAVSMRMRKGCSNQR